MTASAERPDRNNDDDQYPLPDPSSDIDRDWITTEECARMDLANKQFENQIWAWRDRTIEATIVLPENAVPSTRQSCKEALVGFAADLGYQAMFPTDV